MSPVMTEQILANLTLRSAMTFGDRVEAAAASGFTSIALGMAEYCAIKASGLSSGEMVAILDNNGVRLREVEVLYGFAVDESAERIPGPLSFLNYATPEDEAVFFEMADTFGVHHMQTIGTFDRPLEPDAAKRFAGLCDRAADHGLQVALEFVPGTSVPDAGVAGRIVREADRPNGGVCLDVWHHFRGANDEALLRELPPEKIFLLQLCDGTAVPQEDDFLTDTIRNRMVPGEGEFNLAGLFAIMREMNVSAPVSLEVISDSLDEGGPFSVAKRLAGCLDSYGLAR